MQTSYISTAALRNAPRNDTVRLQSELAEKTEEVSTGRHADVGLTLGTSAGQPVRDRMDLSLLEALTTSNATASARLDITQSALGDLEDMASEVLGDLIALPSGDNSAKTMEIETPRRMKGKALHDKRPQCRRSFNTRADSGTCSGYRCVTMMASLTGRGPVMSEGWLTTFCPTTIVLEPPPSRLSASTTSSRSRSACISVKDMPIARPGCRPSITISHQ